MNNKSKSLIIIKTMFLLKITGDEASLIAFNRTISAGLNLIDSLTSDQTNI
jgi:hypothetical protein